MTRNLLMPFIFILFILIFVCPVSAVNLMQNGDFETGDFTSWSNSTGGDTGSYDLSVDSAYAYNSDYGCCLHTQISGPWWRVAWIYQSINLTNVDTLSFDLRVVTISGSSYGYSSDFGVSLDSTDPGNVIYSNSSVGGWSSVDIDVSGDSGVHDILFYANAQSESGSGEVVAYIDNIVVDDGSPSVDGELFIGGSSSHQQWYIDVTDHPERDFYFDEIVDYDINNYDLNYTYMINCSSSNESWSYDYNLIVDSDTGDSLDNSIYQRMGTKTHILYPDVTTCYTFRLYEIQSDIKEKVPWYYFFIYPLYYIFDLFGEDIDTTVTELDSIMISLTRTTDVNESNQDLPDDLPTPLDPPDIPDPINDTIPEPDPEVPADPPTDSGGNQTVNVTFTDGYYLLVNGTVGGLCSPIYNFTAWSLTPITMLNSTVGGFNEDLVISFAFVSDFLSVICSPLACIFDALPSKVISAITYFLVLLVLLIILGR